MLSFYDTFMIFFSIHFNLVKEKFGFSAKEMFHSGKKVIQGYNNMTVCKWKFEMGNFIFELFNP